MTARWTETTLRIDLDDHTDFTVDTTGLPDGDVRVTFCSTPPVEVLMSRECAEVLEDRIRWARLEKRCDNRACVLRYGHIQSCEVAA